jgi:hypothetical protein
MKPPLAWALLILGGCAAGSRRDAPPLPTPSEGRRERDDAIVALYDGQPLRWRAVAEKMLEIDPRTAVETYVRWRVVDDRRKLLGVAPGLDDLKRRAEVQVETVRKSMTDKELNARLASDGLTLRDYKGKLAESAWLSQALTLELIVRYQGLVDGTLTIDRLAFAEEAEARRFAVRCKETGFDAAAEAVATLRGVRRMPRETFARTAPPQDPALDGWIVEALDALKPGELTDVESSRTDLKYVARLVEKKPGVSTPYAEVKAAVLESVLRDPPSPEEIRRWIGSRLAASRLEYPAKANVTNN